MAEAGLFDARAPPEMEVFLSNPRSFKMDRRSPLASWLKDTVSSKLRDFLDDYDDDVLAEYIVVLVCNGKHQTQARDDLEAFLGDGSARFVAWLWELLSRELGGSGIALGSPNKAANVNCRDGDFINKDPKTSTIPDIPFSHDAILDATVSKKKSYELSDSSHKFDQPNSGLVSEAPERWHTSIHGSPTEGNDYGLQTEACDTLKDSGEVDAIHYEVPKFKSSIVQHSPISEGLAGREQQHLGCESQYGKIPRGRSSESSGPSVFLSEKEKIIRHMHSVIADNQLTSLPIKGSSGRTLPSIAVDAAPQHSSRSRGSVWDRLGKPHEEGGGFMRKRKTEHAVGVIDRKILDQKGIEFDNSRMIRAMSDAKLHTGLMGGSAMYESGYTMNASNDLPREHKSLESSLHCAAIDEADIPKRQRQFGGADYMDGPAFYPGIKENYLRNRKPLPKMQNSLSASNSRLQAMNEIKHEENSAFKMLSNHSQKPPRTNQESQANGIFQPRSSRKAPLSTPVKNQVSGSNATAHESKSVGIKEGGRANPGSVNNEILDVKLRLRQIEVDMLKLRSKQSGVGDDKKFSAPSGAPNQSEEDVESRTVLVTNVHFAASREAILSHFSKCGVVAKVIILTDPITAQPKGVSYIVFASKESVDKALQMSGTSFFSRILTVMRKADMPPGFLMPSQPVGKLVQPWHPQPDRKASFQRNYSSTHLQWKREQPASGVNNLSTAGSRQLEVSNAGE